MSDVPFHKTILCLLLLMATSCKRPEQSTASVSLQIPSASQFQKSLQSPSAQTITDYSLFCFVANVKSSQIPSTPASTCDVEKGLIAGSVAPGGTLALDVPAGESTTFEIYGLKRKSTSEICPTNLTGSWNWPVAQIYFMGKTENVKIVPPESLVSVSISLPTQNIALQNNWPSTCGAISTAPGSPLGRVGIAAKVLKGTNYRIYSRVSNREEVNTLSGSKYQIHNWKAQNF